MNESQPKSVTKSLEATRRQLLDTGTRNRLVHVNRANTRANCLNIVNERADDVFSILRIEAKRMRFKALGKDKQPGDDELLLAAEETNVTDDPGRHTDAFLETPLGPEALAKRLLRLATDARTAEEEQGVNILYLAIGFLRWRESTSSQTQRESPLILLPVKLIRNERTSAYDLTVRDEDLTTNLPLQERLRQDFGITLPEIDEVEGWTPTAYFTAVRDKIERQPGWSIDPDGMQLGFFSFAKLLMHRDLDPASWPESSFAENALLNGLLQDGFDDGVGFADDDSKLDDALDPADIIQVIDADASQTRVIEAVRRGTSLVVQGPPGTGKSQTITNLIAAAAHDGKTVLFVAEKMAALSVVHDRLVRSGLRDICLELHSRTANKRAVAQELARTLSASGQVLPAVPDPERLRATRDELNRISDLLHERLPPSQDTPFRTISEIVGFIGSNTPAPRISTDGLEALNLEDRRRAMSAIDSFVAALDRVVDPATHPFRGAQALDLQPMDLSRLSEELGRAHVALGALVDELKATCAAANRPAPPALKDVEVVLGWLEEIGEIPQGSAPLVPLLATGRARDDFRTALQTGITWQALRTDAASVYVPSAIDEPTDSLEQAIALGQSPELRSLNLARIGDGTVLTAAGDALAELQSVARATAEHLGLGLPTSLREVERLCGVMDWLGIAPARTAELTLLLFEAAGKGRLTDALMSGRTWADAQAAARKRFLDVAWNADAIAIRTEIAKGQGSFLARLFGGYGRASSELATLLTGPLPKAPADRLELATELAQVVTARARLAEDERWLQDTLQGEWRGERTPFSELLEVASWMADSRNGGHITQSSTLLTALKAINGAGAQGGRLAERLRNARESLGALLNPLSSSEGADGLLADLDNRAFDAVQLLLDRIGAYRQGSDGLARLLQGALPDAVEDRLGLISQLTALKAQRDSLHAVAPVLSEVLQGHWQREDTPFSAMQSTLDWMDRTQAALPFLSDAALEKVATLYPDPEAQRSRLADLTAAADAALRPPFERLKYDFKAADLPDALEAVPLRTLSDLLAEMNTGIDRYVDWVGLGRARRAMSEAGAGEIIARVEQGELAASAACPEFLYACAEARWTAARKARPELDQLAYLDRHSLVTLFRSLETERIETARTLILERHFNQMPKGSSGEMAVIRGEIARKKGHKPVRWLMNNAPSMIQRIKPVMLMSPISVAQFLPPGKFVFDLLVIDEASQIKPADALGVVARAKQIVVVGDQKQLPPTSFFDRLVDDADDNDDEDSEEPPAAGAAEMESILSLCEARGLRQRMLEWHYRSRDPSLIRVSNAEFYNDGLVLPPSPLERDDDYGLKFRRVAGVYARGGSGIGRQGTNRIEAEEIAKAVARHARDWPDLSLGVVAFSKAQASMVTEVLEVQRRKDQILDAFLREGKSEDVFVKNIENVQGDERDVILITVGYGPQEPNGRLGSISFGPVNSEGGERRLNVLFSRARVRCEVFASFDPGDIDPSKAKRDGPRVLKRFLEFARTGIMEGKEVTGLGADSPFEADVAAVIRSLGYEADPQVGTAGFRVDIGVRHPDRPGQYLMAVECDGAAYHSALWARERDRLRQDVLEGLGWIFHRIWSTDWFHHRAREIQRLREALESARVARLSGVRVRGANKNMPQPQAAPEPSGPTPLEIDHLGLTAQPYQRASLAVQSAVEPHEAPTSQLADLVWRIVEVEGPIHMDELARRITSSFGRTRAGNRIVDATQRAVRLALRDHSELRQDGAFLLTAAQAEDPPIRSRLEETGSLVKAPYLPPMEIRAAAALIQKESGDIPDDDLIREVARLLGFQRVGSELSDVIAMALEL